jgi:hypothetical protein
VSASKDTELGVDYGLSLLNTLDWIDEQVAKEKYSIEQAASHRKRVCEELRGVLRLMKPYNDYLRKRVSLGGVRRW